MNLHIHTILSRGPKRLLISLTKLPCTPPHATLHNRRIAPLSPSWQSKHQEPNPR